MRAKQVYLTGDEKLIVQEMVSLEIKSNIECEKLDIEPAFSTEILRTLYKKLTGYEWKESYKWKDGQWKEVRDSEHQQK